jgi:hypothetical protein
MYTHVARDVERHFPPSLAVARPLWFGPVGASLSAIPMMVHDHAEVVVAPPLVAFKADRQVVPCGDAASYGFDNRTMVAIAALRQDNTAFVLDELLCAADQTIYLVIHSNRRCSADTSQLLLSVLAMPLARMMSMDFIINCAASIELQYSLPASRRARYHH